MVGVLVLVGSSVPVGVTGGVDEGGGVKVIVAVSVGGAVKVKVGGTGVDEGTIVGAGPRQAVISKASSRMVGRRNFFING
jgi:hypothetical protein